MKKIFIAVLLISVVTTTGILFAKKDDAEANHRGRGRGQESSVVLPPESSPPTPNPSSTPTQENSVREAVPQDNEARRQRIRKKIRDDQTTEVDQRGDEEEIRVIVRYVSLNKDTLPRGVDRANKRGAKLRRQFKRHPWAAFRVKKSDLYSDAFDDISVESIEIDVPVKSTLASSLPAISANAIETTYAVTGKGVKVAIIDTGINKNHPALAGKVMSETDLTDSGEGPGDLNGHGTHVACTIACTDSTNRGVAPGASLYNAKALTQNGTGYLSDIIAGIEWATDQDVDIISMSLGAAFTSCDGTDALSVAANNAWDQGILVVVAAGNAGPGTSTITSPGCAEKVITVGAVTDGGTLADFSSRGPTASNASKPNIVAPGVDVTAADKASGFVSLSGTSMATPHIAGALALLKGMTPQKTNAELRDVLYQTIQPLSYDTNSVGVGYVNVEQAVEKLHTELNTPPPAPQPAEPPPAEEVPEPTEPTPPEATPPEETPDAPEDESPEVPGERGEKPKVPRNLLSECLKRVKKDHAAKRRCLQEYIPGVHRGFEKFEDDTTEKIPQKDLKAIERILYNIPVPTKERLAQNKITQNIEKKLEEFREQIEKKNPEEIKAEVKKLKSSLVKLKRRARQTNASRLPR